MRRRARRPRRSARRAASPPTPRLRSAAAEAAAEEEEAAEVEAGGWPWRERARRSRTASSRRGGKNATAPPPPSARCCDITPRTPAYLDRRPKRLRASRGRGDCGEIQRRVVGGHGGSSALSPLLDRFGDYVGDGVVAPVRETGAQALGAGLLPLPPDAVEAVTRAVLALLSRPEWEVRHSALLALRYVLAARETLAPRLLPAALPAAVKALDDKDDDVRGAAAEALYPAAAHLPSHPDFPPLLAGLWGLLARLDDPELLTSPSNVPIMRLISALYALPETQAVPPAGPGSKLADVVPSLFPFAAHPIAAVRLAVWSTLRRLVLGEGARAWIDAVAAPVLRLLFQAILLEEDEETAAAAEEAWREVLGVAGRAATAEAVEKHAASWCSPPPSPSAFDRIPGFSSS